MNLLEPEFMCGDSRPRLRRTKLDECPKRPIPPLLVKPPNHHNSPYQPWVGVRIRKPAPEGRKKLIQISLVVGYVVLLEEHYKLLLKRMLPMMVFLFGDIFCDGRNIRFTRAEDAVSGLPGEFRIPFFVNPARRVRLNDASDFRGGMCRTDANQHVDVVSSAVMIIAVLCISRMMPPR